MTLRILLAASLLFVLSCKGQTSKEPPIVPIRNMYTQPRLNPQAASAFFDDGRTMRQPVQGTVAREMEIDVEIATGRSASGTGYVMSIPKTVLKQHGGMHATLERGRERYGIYCVPCHGNAGTGQGIVVKRGMLPPPTFHEARLRTIPDGQLFASITNGIGNMPSYRHSIPIADRWAIISYVRALQITQAREGEEAAPQAANVADVNSSDASGEAETTATPVGQEAKKPAAAVTKPATAKPAATKPAAAVKPTDAKPAATKKPAAAAEPAEKALAKPAEKKAPTPAANSEASP